ncbi:MULTISPECIES: tetratricopeptide repeat protein [unclassified Sphingomonas]|uniref:tetratricopeptide repeat protein n=1 Tax=Novosphingobium rhizosphaerae TaxID=1551649 RepID=UPI0015C99875
MKLLLSALFVTSALTSAALAADQPVIAPAPSWVKPVNPATDSQPADDAPVRVLLSDEQVSLEPGRRTTYLASAIKIQTSQGLAAANISLPWRPDTDVLTVHKLLIRRGDQAIDVLKSGQAFTVLRREQNLESAVLDGVLTANIQPEGLQVGDTLEFAASVSSSDPTFKNHAEYTAAMWNAIPIEHAHVRVQWPSAMPVRFRAVDIPAMKPVKTGNLMTLELTLEHITPIRPPNGAPPRYRLGRVLELTDFASWADLGALMAPLYDKAVSVLAQGALRAELDRIASQSADPKARALAALLLVQDRVRYVALQMGAGGYVPADAEITWARRFGDCKAKTALLLALLHGMGIEAEPVMVSTFAGDGLDSRLPMVGLLNHVLVRASLGGRTYWLDGTRTGDTSLDRLTTPNFAWGVPLRSNAALVRMLPAPLATPTDDLSIRIDASAGISAPAPITIEETLRGDEAIVMRGGLANLSGDLRDRILQEYWKKQFDFVDVKTIDVLFDPNTGEERLSMSGVATMDWSSGAYETDRTTLGYRADFSRDPAQDRDAPFAVSYPAFHRTVETIVLPKGQGDFVPGPGMDVDQTVAGFEYHRHGAVKDGVFTIESTERSIAPEFPSSEAVDAQATLRALTARTATLRKPAGYKASASEVAASLATTPSSAAEYRQRASLLMQQGRRKEALADFDKAVALDPGDVSGWANRAVIRIQDGDLPGAHADLARALALDPGFVQVFIAQGMLADAEHRPNDALAAYTKALQREPGQAFALHQRAAAHTALGQDEEASADRLAAAEAMAAADPGNARAYGEKGNVELDEGKFDAAIFDFDKALELEPNNAMALADRGLAWVWKDDKVAAERDLDAAFALDPKNPVIFRARGLMAERSNRLADAIAAYTASLKIEPTNAFALEHRARLAYGVGDSAMAERDTAAAIAQRPHAIGLYLLRANVLRGLGRDQDVLAVARSVEAANPAVNYAHVVAANIYSALHRDTDAMQAYDRAIANKPEAYIYLNRGLRRPKADVAGRMADIDAALKLDPALDEAIAEKAKLLADGGDVSGGIATLSKALVAAPDNAVLLVGRGLIYLQAGDAARADADFRQARGSAKTAQDLNAMCWKKAIAGLALESALADCDAALAKVPGSPAFLDSRGLVLLRLGRLDDAIADYDQVLAKHAIPTSRFGRAVAWARKGDHAKAISDAALAEKLDPGVRADFISYGITL